MEAGATEQPPVLAPAKRPIVSLQPQNDRYQLSPSQRNELAQKVATLLRFTLRIERERQG